MHGGSMVYMIDRGAWTPANHADRPTRMNARTRTHTQPRNTLMRRGTVLFLSLKIANEMLLSFYKHTFFIFDK